MLDCYSYIISFAKGTSGRFVKYLLHNLLSESESNLDLFCSVTNSAHATDNRLGYTGYTPSTVVNMHSNIPGLWEWFKFNDPTLYPKLPRIFATHTFPDFKLIKDNLGPDIKIIIITLDVDSIPEVVINDKVKNYYDTIRGMHPDSTNPEIITNLENLYLKFLDKRYPSKFVKEDIIRISKSITSEVLQYYSNRLHVEKEDWIESWLIQHLLLPKDIDYPMDQVLFLPYSEISTVDENNKFIWLKKLEEFTGKLATKITIDSYQKYINGRNQLMKEYRL